MGRLHQILKTQEVDARGGPINDDDTSFRVTTATQAASYYNNLVQSLASTVTGQMPLSKDDLQFRSIDEHPNEAESRIAPDAFLQHLVTIDDRKKDKSGSLCMSSA